MGNRLHVATAAGSAMAVLLLTAGCGSGGGTGSSVGSVRPAAADKAIGDGYTDVYGSAAGDGYGAGAPAGSGSGSGQAGELAVRDIANVGSVVTDSAGSALYRFDKDTAQPPKSSCDGSCATTWPAVPADDAKASAGIDAGALGEVERSDGTRQLTIGGWPVYRYAKDTKAGEAKGEGVGGTWHAVAPDGKKAADGKAAGGTAGSGMAGSGMAGHGKAGGTGDALSLAADAKLGKLLVDSEGRTLYRFDKDSAWPMKFGCLDACLNTWKPAAPVEKEKVSGIPADLVGSVKRPDGSQQLTIDCWPVYLFTGDTAPGQTNGHGKQGLWFAVDGAGKKIPAAS
ncbi:SCO0930 family lipoprotein [Streptomyces sp. NPDC054961]